RRRWPAHRRLSRPQDRAQELRPPLVPQPAGPGLLRGRRRPGGAVMPADLPFIDYVDAVEAALEARYGVDLFTGDIDLAELDAAQQEGLTPAEAARDAASARNLVPAEAEVRP